MPGGSGRSLWRPNQRVSITEGDARDTVGERKVERDSLCQTDDSQHPFRVIFCLTTEHGERTRIIDLIYASSNRRRGQNRSWLSP